jgi:hypothetical protein
MEVISNSNDNILHYDNQIQNFINLYLKEDQLNHLHHSHSHIEINYTSSMKDLDKILCNNSEDKNLIFKIIHHPNFMKFWVNFLKNEDENFQQFSIENEKLIKIIVNEINIENLFLEIKTLNNNIIPPSIILFFELIFLNSENQNLFSSLSKENISFLLNLSLHHKSNLITSLQYYIIKNGNSSEKNKVQIEDYKKQIHKFIEDSIRLVSKENELREKQINLVSLGNEIEKLNKLLTDNQTNFKNYKSYLNYLKSSKDKKSSNQNFLTIEGYMNTENEIKENLNKQQKIKEILSEYEKMIVMLKKSTLEDISFTIENKVDLFLIVEEYIITLKNDLQIINDKSLNSLLMHLNSKKEYLMKIIEKDFSDFVEKYVLRVEDKKIEIFDLSKYSNLNEEDKQNLPDPFTIFEIISTNFPEFIISLLQKVYSHFLYFLTNKNYKIIKNENSSENENETNQSQIFSFTLKDENNKENNFQMDSKSLEEFNIFLEIISTFYNVFSTYLNSASTESILQITENEENLINYDLYYGGSSKKSKNSFIFVFSYCISQYYKNFKETILDNYSNRSFSDYEKINFVGNIKKSWENYKNITEKFTTQYNSIKNFNFYNNNDFIMIMSESALLEENENNLIFQKFFFTFRDLVKNSYLEAKDLLVSQYKIIDLLNEIFKLDLTEEEIKKFTLLDIISDDSHDTHYEKFLTFNYTIILSKNFSQLLHKFFEYINNQKTYQVNLEEKISNLFSLLYTLYNAYFKQNENSTANFSEILLLHNNIEALLLCLQFCYLFDSSSNLSQKISKDFFKKLIIFFKNFSSSMINQIISNFIRELIGELSIVESFEDIRFERNSKVVDRLIKNSLDLIFKFFDLFKEFANEKDLLFHLNYILSLFFDILNRKIMSVKDFNIDDTKVLLKLSKFITDDIKKNFEKILNFQGGEKNNSDSMSLTHMLENNQKYKKFEEILFVLNASMKEIRNFIIQSNYSIHIDPIELIELVKSIFEDNQNRSNLIEFINEKLLNPQAQGPGQGDKNL